MGEREYVCMVTTSSLASPPASSPAPSPPPRYTPTSRYIHSAPMFHLADGASTFGITMAGGSHIFIPKFEPKHMLQVSTEQTYANLGRTESALFSFFLSRA